MVGYSSRVIGIAIDIYILNTIFMPYCFAYRNMPPPVLAPKGRGKKLLAALEELSAPRPRSSQSTVTGGSVCVDTPPPLASVRNSDNTEEIHPTMTLRLPRTQSIGTCLS